MVTSRMDAPEDAILSGRIRRMLENQLTVGLRDAVRLLGGDDGAVKAELESLVAAGEVERLRPVAYPGDEFDFYRLKSPISATVQRAARRVWREIRDIRAYARWAG